MGYYNIYQKIGGYPAVVSLYLQEKDISKCEQVINGLLDIFINESKRYFKDIIDVNIFEKVFNAISLLMLKEKTGIRDLTTELSKIAYQDENGRTTKKIINNAISWLQESHIIGYVGKSIDCDYLQIKENSRFYFLDMGVAYHFLKLTGAPFSQIKGILAENFVYLALRRHVKKDIAGISPWFALYQKTQRELDFYVRSLLDYKNYGIEVKSTDAKAKTARTLLRDKKIDYLYLLKGDTQGGIVEEERIITVLLCLADKISFQLEEDSTM